LEQRFPARATATRKLAHLDYRDDARVLLNGVTPRCLRHVHTTIYRDAAIRHWQIFRLADNLRLTISRLLANYQLIQKNRKNHILLSYFSYLFRL